MLSLLFLLIFPLCWPFVAKIIWKHELTWTEHVINIIVGVGVVLLGFALSFYSNVGDREIYNGQVTSKESVRVSCSHSYSCRCRQVCSGSGSNRSCSTHCDTCYDHSYDVDHVVSSTIGSFKIDRVNRQGTTIPPRFTKVQVGDPVADTRYFSNYVKAAPDSLFNRTKSELLINQFGATLPEYPLEVFDYHYLNRVLPVGVNVADIAEWNMELANALRPLGPSKKVNVVVVMTASKDTTYANALEAKWLGGKMNDVVVVLGVPEYPKLAWARVFSWSDEQLFKVELRNALTEQESVSPKATIGVIAEQIVKGFKRKDRKDFEYLKGESDPPLWLLITLFFISASVSVGMTLYLVNNDEREGHTPRNGLRRWR